MKAALSAGPENPDLPVRRNRLDYCGLHAVPLLPLAAVPEAAAVSQAQALLFRKRLEYPLQGICCRCMQREFSSVTGPAVRYAAIAGPG